MVVSEHNYTLWRIIFFLLSLILISLIVAILSLFDSSLHIVMCDVGQGDAILIHKQDFQILVDGGPDYSVLTCLQKHMPWWDRKVDVVLMTHPEEDHAKGLISVFERYDVQYFFKTKYKNSTEFYRVLEERVGSQGTKIIEASDRTDMRYNMIYLDIVYPTTSILAQNSEVNEDFNQFSVISIISYKDFDILLTGDIEGEGLDNLIASNKLKDIDIIKVPHHGSKNGLTQELLTLTKPESALISVGKKNRYRHPHKEIIEMLDQSQIKVRRTDLEGEIELKIP